MGNVKLSAILSVLILTAADISRDVVWSDTVIMKDGSKHSGKIVGRLQDPMLLLSSKYLAIRLDPDTKQADTASALRHTLSSRKPSIDSTQSDSALRARSSRRPTKDDSLAANKPDTTKARVGRPDSSSAGALRDTSITAHVVSRSVRPLQVEDVQLIVIDDPDTVRIYDVDAVAAAIRARSPASLAIGASLDFLRGVKATDIYYRLSFMTPDMFYDYRTFRKNSHSSLLARLLPSGFSLKFEQGRLGTRDTSTIHSSVQVFSGDTSYVGTLLQRSTVTEFSTLDFSLYWPLWRRSDPSMRAFVAMKNEFRRVGFENRTTGPLRSNPDSLPLDSGTVTVTSRREVRDRLVSYGFALVADLQDASAQVFVGWSSQNGRTDFGIYQIQAVVRENRYGITVAGEVRGLQTPETLFEYAGRDPRRFPEYAVSVSKTFSLDKVGEFLGN